MRADRYLQRLRPQVRGNKMIILSRIYIGE